jgi:protein MPE1
VHSAIVEYRDDSQIVPRSTSVIVKRRPAVRPGKGKAAMYISGTPGASSEKHASIVTPANNTWHRPGLPSGHTSKRFDSREKDKERDEPQKPVRVVAREILAAKHRVSVTHEPLSYKVLKSLVATDDEAVAMAAMFQAQSANWEETKEKMSQFVFPVDAGSLFCSISDCLMGSCFLSLSVRATRIDFKPRAGSFNPRGGKPFSHQPEKPLPPSYVCYRCGQKGLASWRNATVVQGPHTLNRTLDPGLSDE